MNSFEVEALIKLFLSSGNDDFPLITLQCNHTPKLNMKIQKSKEFSAFELMDELMYSIANESTLQFRKSLRDTDLLIIKDFGFLKTRIATQKFLNDILLVRKIHKKKTIIFSEERIKSLKKIRKDLKKIVMSGLIIEGLNNEIK